jgi:hypothetical protein
MREAAPLLELLNEIHGLRNQLTAARDALRSATASLPPDAELVEQARALVQTAGARWAEEHAGFWAGSIAGRRVVNPAGTGDTCYPGHLPPLLNDPTPFGFDCLADPERMVRGITRLLAASPHRRGLARAERPAALAQLQATVTALESREEARVDQVLRLGAADPRITVTIAHRPDVVARRERERRAAERAQRVEAEHAKVAAAVNARANARVQ